MIFLITNESFEDMIFSYRLVGADMELLGKNETRNILPRRALHNKVMEAIIPFITKFTIIIGVKSMFTLVNINSSNDLLDKRNHANSFF